MALNFVLNRWGKPSLCLLSIEKASLAIACLSVSSSTTELPTGCQQLLYIVSRQRFSLKEYGLLRGCRNTEMLCPCINPKRHLLLVSAASIEQLERERNHLHDLGLAL